MLFLSRLRTWFRKMSTLYGVATKLDFSLEKNDQTLEGSNTSLNLVPQQQNSTDLNLTCNITCEFKGYEHIRVSFDILIYDQTLEHPGESGLFKLSKLKISERDVGKIKPESAKPLSNRLTFGASVTSFFDFIRNLLTK
jgi:hypothetical protein